MNIYTEPLVSVVMTVYNEERFLEIAIESILSQSYINWELIIVDDCSTDGTSRIIQKYLADKRISCIKHNENKGVTISANDGIALANGTYIARMDADDISLPDRLKTQVAFLQEHLEYALVGSHTIIIDEKGNKLLKIRLPQNDHEIKKALLKGNVFIHGSLMFRTAMLKNVGGYDENIKGCEDFELILHISKKYPVANVSDLLYCWRKTTRGESNISKKELSARASLAKKVYEAKMSGDQQQLARIYSLFLEHYERTAVLKRPEDEVLKSLYAKDLIRGCLFHGVKKSRMEPYFQILYSCPGMKNQHLIFKTLSFMPSSFRKALYLLIIKILKINYRIISFE